MEKKRIDTQLKGARWVILLFGIISWFCMVFSDYGDEALRWSLMFLIAGVTFFMFVVTTFIAYFLSNK